MLILNQQVWVGPEDLHFCLVPLGMLLLAL
jgi:hypothetical protein